MLHWFRIVFGAVLTGLYVAAIGGYFALFAWIMWKGLNQNWHDWQDRQFGFREFIVRLGPARIHVMRSGYQGQRLIPLRRGRLDDSGGAVTFVGEAQHDFETRFPLAELAWINPWSQTVGRRLPDGAWQVYAFANHHTWTALAETLHRDHGITLGESYDLGPLEGRFMAQDIYGRWDAQPIAQFYLSPEQLLVNWRTELRLADLRGIMLITEYSRMGKFSLLRLEVDEPDVPRRVIGFVLDAGSAAQWAQELGTRAGIPVQTQSQRKKKEARQ